MPDPLGLTLAESHDGVFLDLDGTLFTGAQPIPGAASALEQLSCPAVFVTNNASRLPSQVADHLTDLGFSARSDDVMTSAQAAVALLSEHIAPGSRVLIVGAPSFGELAGDAGYEVVSSADDAPVAVLQGLSKELTWSEMAEGALAIRAGALWIAANLDPTLPAERGFLPGNGSFVAAMRVATDVGPLVAGKPSASVFRAAADRVGSTTGLVVGDRLDTDIEGGVAAGMSALAVLTGSHGPTDILRADPPRRPTHLAASVTGLHEPEATLRIAPDPSLETSVRGDTLVVVTAPADRDDLAVARAVIASAWAHDTPRIAAADQDLARRLSSLGMDVD